MKRIRLAFAVLLVLSCSLAIAEEAPASVKKLVPTIQSWGTNPVLVAAVKAQNAKGATLEQIKTRDQAWQATSGVDDSMKALMHNDAAKELGKLERTAPWYLELFLMDNKGANVAMTNKTSDYWQGDEPKFTESYKDGAGAVHIGKVTFDASAQAYLVQISVPVMDGATAIGALTVGVNLDKLGK
jgi:opacity protein-like surface antigen